MQIDSEVLQWVQGISLLLVTWIGKVVWADHKALNEHKEHVAKTYPTKEEIDHKLEDHKQDLTYIRDKLDKVVDRMLDESTKKH